MEGKDEIVEGIVKFVDALDVFVTTDPRTNQMFADAVRAIPEGYGLIHGPSGWRYCRLEDVARSDVRGWETVEYVMLELGKEQPGGDQP